MSEPTASPAAAGAADGSPEPAAPAAPAAPARANHWRRRPRGVPIPAENAKRQGEITQLAFLLLGRERAIDFLNAEHAALGGRPLALATASAEGRARVEGELGRMAYRQPGEAAPSLEAPLPPAPAARAD